MRIFVAMSGGMDSAVVAAEARLRESVIDGFAAGETSVPCVQCRGVRSANLLGLARDLGAEAMATRYYVRRVGSGHGIELHRPLDADRDQLDFLRFPLGEMPDREAVRAEAVRVGLAVMDKPDSQDLWSVQGMRLIPASSNGCARTSP